MRGEWLHPGRQPSGEYFSLLSTKEEEGGEQNRAEILSNYALFNTLGQYEYYPQNHRVTEYVGKLVNKLTDDPEYEVWVINTKKANAFALPDKTIVIIRGLLEMMEYDEEIYGVLAHEVIHIEQGHAEESLTLKEALTNPLATIGTLRKGEIEADLSGAEKLDKQGINPIGMVSLLEKQENAFPESEEKKVETGHEGEIDIEHGSLTDRRLTLKEAARFKELPSLSLPLHPIGLTKEEFADVRSDEEAWEEVGTMSLEDLRFFVERQVRKLNEDLAELKEKKVREELGEEGVRKRQQKINDRLRALVDIQTRRLIPAMFPDMKERYQGNLLYLINYLGFELDEEAVIHLGEDGKSGELSRERFLQQFDSLERVAAFGDMLYAGYLEQMGVYIKPNRLFELFEDVLRQSLRQGAFNQNEAEGDKVNVRQYIETSKAVAVSIQEFIKRQGGDGIGDPYTLGEIIVKTAYDYLVEQGQYESMEELGKLAADIKVPVFKFITSLFFGKPVSLLVENDMPDENGFDGDEGWTIHMPQQVLELLGQLSLPEPAVPLVSALRRKREKWIDSFPTKLEKIWATLVSELGEPMDPFLAGYILLAQKAYNIWSEVSLQIKTLTDFYKKLVQKSKYYNFAQIVSDPAVCVGHWGYTFCIFEQGLGQRDKYEISFEEEHRLREKLESERWKLPLLMAIRNISLEEYLADVDWNIGWLISEPYENEFILDRFDKVREAILQAAKQRNQLGFKPEWTVTTADLNRMPNLLGALKYALVIEIADRKTSAFPLLSQALRNYPLFRVRAVPLPDSLYGWFEEQDDPEKQEKYQEKWVEFLTKALSRNWNLKNKGMLYDLFHLSCIVGKPQVLLQLPSFCARKIVEQLDFNKAVRFIFEDYGHLPYIVFRDAVDYLVEKEARTLDEFATLEEKLKQQFIRRVRDYERIGMAAVADLLSYKYLESADELLWALLTTATNDRPFKEYLARRWWVASRTAVGEPFRMYQVPYLARYGNEYQRRRWVQHVPSPATCPAYVPLQDVIDSFYLMGDVTKHLLLRRLLTGKHGVLRSKEKRRKLLDTFVKELIDFGGDKEAELKTRQLLTALMEVGSMDELYLSLVSVLEDLILRVPKKETPIEEIAAVIAREELDKLQDEGRISGWSEEALNYAIELTTIKITNLMTGVVEQEDGQRSEADIELRLLSLIPEEERETIEQFTPWRLAVEVGERAGAVGVRILQLAGQYFEVPKNERPNLLRVYDRVEGQSRLAAYQALTHAAKNDPTIAALVENIVEIRPRIGGGSLFTMYQLLMKDGSQESIGIKNPNAEYHTQETVRLLRKVIAHLRQQEPDNTDFALLEVLLDDVVEWINRELDDENFYEKDRRFRELNHYEFGRFEVKDGYKILVPQSKPTNSEWIRLDGEIIDGKNLTELEVVEGETDIKAGVISLEDYKRVVSTLVRNLHHQIETGLVHPDFHPGNFRITFDNEHIAIFDRRGLLELTEEDKSFIKNIVVNLAKNPAQVPEIFLNYLLYQQENEEYQAKRQELLQALNQSSEGFSGEEAARQIIIQAKRLGLKVPLHISLIFKNILFLNNIAAEAGFESLIEAYRYADRSIKGRVAWRLIKKEQ